MRTAVLALTLTAVFFGGLVSPPQVVAVPTIMPRGLQILDIEKIVPGVIIYSSANNTSYAISPLGDVVHSWEMPPNAERLTHPRPLANGNILANITVDLENDLRAIVEMDFDGNVVHQWDDPGNYLFHHDHELLPNGNYLFLCSRLITRLEISSLELVDDCLVEMDVDGNIVWEWQTADHFDEFGFTQSQLDGIADSGGDWAHANAAVAIPVDTSHTDPRFAPGNVIISFRFISRVVVVDRATDAIVWISNETVGQHNSQMIPDYLPSGDTEDPITHGNILVFDNGHGDLYERRDRYYSRIVEIDPLTDEVVWQYTADSLPDSAGLPRWHFDSWFVSSVQRLPNGNTLIDEGAFGRFFQVTPEGETVWEFINPFAGPSGRTGTGPLTNFVYRAYWVPPVWFGMEAAELMRGDF